MTDPITSESRDDEAEPDLDPMSDESDDPESELEPAAADEIEGGAGGPDVTSPWEQPVQRLDVVEADRVEISRGSVGRATAGSLALRQGAIGGAQAEQVNVTLGAVGGARAQYVSVDRGVIGGAVAGQVTVRQGYVQNVLARDVRLEQSGARTVIANKVSLGPQSGAFVVFARSVEGSGRILVDWRAGLALGGVVGAVLVLLRVRRG